jgi:signal transduction histidine kinase
MRNVEQMDELISSLLDIGRIEAGLEMEMAPVRLEEVVEEVVANLQGEAKTKELGLDAVIADDLSLVRGNHTRLVQVMSNLLDNAIRYTPPGGSVVVRASDDGEKVTVSVSDTGVGIPAQARDHVFEKFYRVEGRETLSSEGMGLGLATVKSIVEKHGGRVWVESKEGEGSTFHFVLPRIEEGSSDE